MSMTVSIHVPNVGRERTNGLQLSHGKVWTLRVEHSCMLFVFVFAAVVPWHRSGVSGLNAVAIFVACSFVAVVPWQRLDAPGLNAVAFCSFSCLLQLSCGKGWALRG